MDYFFQAFCQSLWVGVIGLVWIFKAIAWVVSAILNRKQINRP